MRLLGRLWYIVTGRRRKPTLPTSSPCISRYSVSAVIVLIGVLVWPVPRLAQQRPTTLRQALAGVTGLDNFPDAFLDAPIPEPKPGRRYVVIGLHINPSAERLLVLSSDFKLVHELYGWELATLPNESIVYHQSQVHFASTHSLEISVFDHGTGLLVQRDWAERVLVTCTPLAPAVRIQCRETRAP